MPCWRVPWGTGRSSSRSGPRAPQRPPPGGAETSLRLARAHTTLDRSPEELHAVGLAEIERIDAEITELGGRVLGTANLAATLAALRGDPSVHFSTADEVAAVAEQSLARAVAAIPAWFGRLPQAGGGGGRRVPPQGGASPPAP